MRNIEKLRDYFLGKDPQLKETMADNSLRLIGIEGKYFVLRTELLARLKKLKDELTEVDEDLQRQIDGVIDDLEGVDGRVTALETWKDNTDFVEADDLALALAGYYSKTQVDNLLASKQDKLIAGNNITIIGNVISATGGGGGGGDIIELTSNLVLNDTGLDGIYHNNTFSMLDILAVDGETILENINAGQYVAVSEVSSKVYVVTSVFDNAVTNFNYDVVNDTAIYSDKFLTNFVMKSGDTMSGNLTTPSIVVGSLAQNTTIGSHAAVIGTLNTATGARAVAEGQGTTASANNAHAEGEGTTASDKNAHAEGKSSTASGENSHAEGKSTTAYADNSHAEGESTSTGGDDAHAEGSNTYASGNYSHAEGHGSIASSESAHAEGSDTVASAAHSHAEGYGTHAEGSCCHAEGFYTTASGTASGYDSHAGGAYTDATGPRSFAHGHGTSTAHVTASGTGAVAFGGTYTANDITTATTASGYDAFAVGSGCTASESGSVAMQMHATSSGVQSCAIGHNTISDQSHSVALGWNAVAQGFGQFAFGTNVVDAYGSSISSSDGQFIFGTGVNGTRTNGMKLTHGGDLYVAGTVTPNGADYAEAFEWADGNTQNEDRVGLFVRITGKNIRKADGTDPRNLIGVVSAEPTILGDSYMDYWHGKYERDVFGRVRTQMTTHTLETEDGEGNIITETATSEDPIISQDYDETQTYIPRLQRPEYSAVAFLGKIVVTDDGTCQAEGYCYPGTDGIATAEADPDKGFYVMERLDQTHIRVLLK